MKKRNARSDAEVGNPDLLGFNPIDLGLCVYWINKETDECQ